MSLIESTQLLDDNLVWTVTVCTYEGLNNCHVKNLPHRKRIGL